MVRRAAVPVLGVLNKPDWETNVVRLRQPNGRAMLLHYDPALEPSISESFHKWIVGRMVVEEPENASLPKAPRRRRTLTRVEHVFELLDDVPKYLIP
jgi:hypothetical protein